MSWVKLDDRMPEHRKVAGLSDRAFRAHIEALCYCAGNLTDGFVPGALAKARRWQRSAVELVEAELWEVCEGGWEIHDYLEHQRSKDDAIALSEKRAAIGARGGKAKANAQQFAKQTGKQTPSRSRSEEIREEPNPTDSDKTKRVKRELTLTDEARTAFRAKWRAVATEVEVDEQISLALSHKSVRNYDRTDLYVGNWLRRSFEGRNGERTTAGGARVAGGQSNRGTAGPRGMAAFRGGPGADVAGFGDAPPGSVRADDGAPEGNPGAQPEPRNSGGTYPRAVSW